MIGELSPGLVLILGALLVPILKGFLRSVLMLALPAIALWQLTQLGFGTFGTYEMMGLTLNPVRIDSLSFVFAVIFIIAAFLSVVYALHVDDRVQQVAGLVYAGSAVGAVLAGDLVTLFLFWEGTAIASVFLIWASRNERAYWAGLRYLTIHIGSGVLLLAGVLIHYHATKSIAFDAIGLNAPGGWLIFLGIGIKCAFPLLHNWLQDAYPEATVTGTVWLSAFTTKLAIYALARGYAGTEILLPIGAVMAVAPIIFMAIENDLRRVIAYALMSQLGFMVVAIGVGTELAINGAAAHAFTGILYKGLLFMAIGAVLYRTGTAKATDLGGLARSMPWTAAFCLIGAASISAFPLFAGFVSKSPILSATMKEGHFAVWLALLVAGAGGFLFAGLKVPYAAFFARDSGKRCDEAPANMLLAMALAALACIGIGLFPSSLYALMPNQVGYAPYTLTHIITQLQLLMFSALAFVVLTRVGLYPQERRATNLDVDWFYRKAGYRIVAGLESARGGVWSAIVTGVGGTASTMLRRIQRAHGPNGSLGRSWATGTMAFWTTAMLLGYLLVAMLA